MRKSSSNTLTLSGKSALVALATRIDAARKIKGYTIEKLCERAGVSRGLYHRFMNGDPGVSIGSVIELINMLGLLDQLDDVASVKDDNVLLQKLTSSLPVRIHQSKEAF